MPTYAGVALSRVASGAPFSFTLVSSDDDQPVLTETTTDILSGDTPDAIVKSISDLAGNAKLALALPTSVIAEQKSAFSVNSLALRHSLAFRQLYFFENTNTDDSPINFLFLDTTPGQAAAELSSVEFDECWCFGHEEPTILPEASIETLSAQDIMVKLVVPTVPKSTKLHQIAILCAEEEYPELELALKTLFPSVHVKWVTLADLSRGAALWIHRMLPTGPGVSILAFVVAVLPVGILLADGRIATLVRRNMTLPISKTIVLTTSHDNQTTVTLQFVNGKKPCGQVVLEGITPKPKGAVRIQISIEVDYEGEAVATVEELDSTNKKVAELVNVFSITKEEIEDFLARQDESGANAQLYYDGLEMGELPV